MSDPSTLLPAEISFSCESEDSRRTSSASRRSEPAPDAPSPFPCTLAQMEQRIRAIDKLPALPGVLAELMACLERPPAEVDIEQVVHLISREETVAAQCVRMANSALFGRRRMVESVREAVINLGLWRMSEIAFSCSLPNLFASFPKAIDRATFWRHSLACAMVSQRLARVVRSCAADKAYLAGLLHDLGILVNATLLPAPCNDVFVRASREGMPLHNAEIEMLGFTHAETGSLLGQAWKLSPDIVSVLRYHHDIEAAPEARDLVALVHLSDLFCRERGLGYGYYEARRIDFTCSPAWLILVQTCRQMGRPELGRFFRDLDDYFGEVVTVVDGFFPAAGRPQLVPQSR